jgi:hypothetical protein
MTDILSSSLKFLLWGCVYLARRYAWKRSTCLVVFLPFMPVMIWQFLVISQIASPVTIGVQPSIGRPLNSVLELATMGLILLFFVTAIRDAARNGAEEEGR